MFEPDFIVDSGAACGLRCTPSQQLVADAQHRQLARRLQEGSVHLVQGLDASLQVCKDELRLFDGALVYDVLHHHIRQPCISAQDISGMWQAEYRPQ